MVQEVRRIALIAGTLLSASLGFLAVLELFDRTLFKSGFSVLMILAFFIGLIFFFHKTFQFPEHPHRDNWIDWLIAFVAITLPLASPIVCMFLMSGGEFPKVFFGVDSSYHLSQVFALMQDFSYPPESLNNVGISFNYHFGAQLASAALAKTFRLYPHFVYLGLMPVLLIISAICCVRLLISHQRSRLYRTGVLFLLLINFHYIANDFPPTAYLFGIESFRGGFPHVSTIAVMTFFVFLVFAYETAFDSWFGFLSVAFLPSLVLLFKSPYVFSFLSFYAGVVCIEFFRRKLTFRHGLAIAASGLLFVWVAKNVGNGNAEFQYVGFLEKAEVSHWLLAKSVLFLGVPFLVMLTHVSTEVFFRTIPYFLAVLFPLAFALSFDLKIAGQVDPNIWQVSVMLPFLLYGGFIRLLPEARVGPLVKTLSLFLFLSISSFPVVLNRAINLGQLLSTPASWHEYVDNKGLGSCLRQVPVKGSLLVTNDLRYPADNFSRNMLQMQIPALFGHQMYAGNQLWEKYYVDVARFEEQALLVKGDWPSIERSAKKHGWTHAILFRRTEHVRLPLPILCENEEVVIVAFTTPSNGGDSFR